MSRFALSNDIEAPLYLQRQKEKLMHRGGYHIVCIKMSKLNAVSLFIPKRKTPRDEKLRRHRPSQKRTNEPTKQNLLDRFVTHNTKYGPFILVNGSALRHLVVHSLTLLLTCNAFIQSHPNQGIQTGSQPARQPTNRPTYQPMMITRKTIINPQNISRMTPEEEHGEEKQTRYKESGVAG